MLEPAVSWLSERFNWWRPLAVAFVAALVWGLGLVSVLSFNLWSEISWRGMSLFTLMDFVAANILLPLGGLLIAILVGWVMRREVVQDELPVEGGLIFSLWYGLLRYIAVPGVVLVLVLSFL